MVSCAIFQNLHFFKFKVVFQRFAYVVCDCGLFTFALNDITFWKYTTAYCVLRILINCHLCRFSHFHLVHITFWRRLVHLAEYFGIKVFK